MIAKRRAKAVDPPPSLMGFNFRFRVFNSRLLNSALLNSPETSQGKLQGSGLKVSDPEGPYTLPMELGPKKTSLFWFLGPNFIMVVYVGPSG